jgi:hypothetical protein
MLQLILTIRRPAQLTLHEGRQRGPGLQFPREHGSTEQRAALWGGAGVTPVRWRTSALITISATLKLPQCSRLMELRESADGLRWAIGRAGAMGSFGRK